MTIPVMKKNPLGNCGIQGDWVGLRIGHCAGIFLVFSHQHLEEGHDLLAMR